MVSVLVFPPRSCGLLCDSAPLMRRQRGGSDDATAQATASAAFYGGRVFPGNRIGLNRITNRELHYELRELVYVSRAFRPHVASIAVAMRSGKLKDGRRDRATVVNS